MLQNVSTLIFDLDGTSSFPACLKTVRSAVMIGDREVDISSAKANGLRSIGVLWGFGDMAELAGACADTDTILRNTNELARFGC